MRRLLLSYQISQAYLCLMLKEFCENNINIPAYIITPKIEYMETFLDMFYHKYHTVEEYLLTIGLDNKEILKLKQKLID